MIDQYWSTILIVLKLLVAMLCGGAIGLERELSRKAAGLRTNVLICIGAALYMIVSRHLGSEAGTDPARLAAQVVTGIGFLGAGVILRSRGSVSGLTTAATIFVVCAVGICVGAGLFGLGVFATALIILVLVALRRVERAILKHSRLFHYKLTTRDPAEFLEGLLDILEREHLRLEEFDVHDTTPGQHEVRFSVVSSLECNSRLLQDLPKLGHDLRTSTLSRPE
jgi:putative Mg2+ transporter-C (MgtC) family protein